MYEHKYGRKPSWPPPDVDRDRTMYALPLFMLFTIVCAVLVSCAT